jgi:VTC domain
MRSPRATTNVAAPFAPAQGERELKFTLSEGRVDLARGWLERMCRRDSKFPTAIVWTIYYDTPALLSLGEKINSDYLKRKIRVRWYSDLAGRATGPAFVEAKLRVGNQRSKVRERLPYPAEELAGWDLQDARLRAFPKLLNQLGILAHDSWQPLMLIRYRRDRFIEPLSNSRISLDSDIAAAALNRTFMSVIDPAPIGVAVLEVKGASDALPLALRPLLQLGLHKRSFSKFLVVYSHMMRRVL